MKFLAVLSSARPIDLDVGFHARDRLRLQSRLSRIRGSEWEFIQIRFYSSIVSVFVRRSDG